MTKVNEKIVNELEAAGYEFATAIATEDEIRNQAACGQIALIEEEIK